MADTTRALNAPALAAWTTVPARLAALLAFATCLSVPLALGSVGGVELPLSIVAIVMAVPCYFKTPAIVEKKLLTFSVLLAALAAAWTVARGESRSSTHAVLSLGYFFAPYSTFFAGYVLTRRQQDLTRVLSVASFLFSLVAVAVTASLIMSGDPVRVERIGRMGDWVGGGAALAGSMLGLPLYATWGVISLATFYATMLAVVCIRLRYHPPRDVLSTLLLAAGCACLLYLVAGSLSRTVATGMAVFAVAFTWSLLRRRSVQRLILGAAVPGLLALVTVGVLYGDRITESKWAAIARTNVQSLKSDRLNAFTSGRLTLVQAAVEDLIDRPLTGSGFGGFRKGVDPFNSSPHNQYLTATWKMGVPAAAFYFAFLSRCVHNLLCLRRQRGRASVYEGFWALVLAYALGFCLTWDALLVPLTGGFVMFLFGAFARLARQDRAVNVVEGLV